ncbi:hypothetical protein H1C71_002883 [Ictidomys tridecemlineatus]|nr:hypothetical protein H1C71_002883 [Ictidomys tridecemlineatus]KAG3266397.1 hypothetical protein H1C71_002883 [Ictidomys tridecemlineatus]KAG3266398.1 hypothetical protein H1C71_002883 [Ictidomys tridecemlineatus]
MLTKHILSESFVELFNLPFHFSTIDCAKAFVSLLSSCLQPFLHICFTSLTRIPIFCYFRITQTVLSMLSHCSMKHWPVKESCVICSLQVIHPKMLNNPIFFQEQSPKETARVISPRWFREWE